MYMCCFKHMLTGIYEYSHHKHGSVMLFGICIRPICCIYTKDEQVGLHILLSRCLGYHIYLQHHQVLL